MTAGGTRPPWGVSGLSGFSEGALPEPVAEPLIGARTFSVGVTGPMPEGPVGDGGSVVYTNLLGALHGIFQKSWRWGNGTNEAVCMVRPVTARLLEEEGRAAWERKLEDHRREKVPTSCTCGFWAYGDDTTPKGTRPIWGVIEGWGRIIVGSRGFRCQRARLLAVVFPYPDDWSPAEHNSPFRGGGDVITDPDRIKAAIAVNYPALEFMDSIAELNDKYPTTDLSRFVEDEEESA